jgi:hypothetical protein
VVEEVVFFRDKVQRMEQMVDPEDPEAAAKVQDRRQEVMVPLTLEEEVAAEIIP